MTRGPSAESDIVQLTAFRVGKEEYVVDIMRVREIIRAQQITRVRRGPKFVEGVINLRGSVIPLVDMRRRFGLPAEDHRHRKVIILTVEGHVLGLVVDGVTDVVRVSRSAIQPAPGLFGGGRAPFFLGVCHFKGRTLVLLNLKAIAASDDDIDVPTSVELAEEAPSR